MICVSKEEYFKFYPYVIANLEDEFAASTCFDPDFIAQICYDGFLPMTDSFSEEYLLMKLHDSRCIIDPLECRAGKTIKKRAREYTICTDRDLSGVLEGIANQHEYNWLTYKLSSAIEKLVCSSEYPVSFHTVEIYKDNVLSAGEIGYISGKRYLSMTGFYRENGAGSVLLYTLAGLLGKSGFTVWDLGMELGYKTNLGGKSIPRSDFLKIIHEIRNDSVVFPLLQNAGCLEYISFKTDE